MVVAGCFVLNEKNEVLLQLRSDNGKWGHPGGFMEFGETVEDTARREVFEETGLKLGKLEFLMCILEKIRKSYLTVIKLP